MTINKLLEALETIDQLRFLDAQGALIPPHAHLTEAALVRKHYIDCGGVERREESVSLQLFVAGDIDHRLAPSKLHGILTTASSRLGLRNEEVFIEYQQDSISTYGLEFDGMAFHLLPKFTQCLASDSCGIPAEQLPRTNAACTPGGGCC